MKTTRKVRIWVVAQKKVELKFLHQIVGYVEMYRILRSLIINFDQTPSKYVQVSSMTMDKEGETNVSISGITDKRWITATCSIILDNRYHLPMQLIYKGKSNQVLPNVSFPGEFLKFFFKKKTLKIKKP